MQAFARETVPLTGTTLLSTLERLVQETRAQEPDSSINWQARAELRPAAASTADEAVWLHLSAETTVPLTCQRCMGSVQTPLHFDQWYRFVATEDIAMAEDDESEEDLLVMEPQFDLLALLEDELLMALPLVPMHDECPEPPVLRVGDADVPEEAPTKPNPFAMLAQLKKK